MDKRKFYESLLNSPAVGDSLRTKYGPKPAPAPAPSLPEAPKDPLADADDSVLDYILDLFKSKSAKSPEQLAEEKRVREEALADTDPLRGAVPPGSTEHGGMIGGGKTLDVVRKGPPLPKRGEEDEET